MSFADRAWDIRCLAGSHRMRFAALRLRKVMVLGTARIAAMRRLLASCQQRHSDGARGF